MKTEARKKHEKELFELSRNHTMPAVRQLLLKRLYGSAISPEVVDSLFLIWKKQDELFEELKLKENRRTEPWAETLLALLNDETREPHNNQYVKPGLDLLEEVQRTGDIFFPGYWVNALLGGHRSQEAKKIVEDFVNAHPDYPQKLKNKLLEAAFGIMNKR